MDVAIVGIGLHPVGRSEGMSGLQQGAHAARLALSDAGAEWKDMQLLAKGEYPWEKKIGANNPPLKTEHGWLQIYHGVS